MEEKISQKARRVLVIFLLLMLLCTGISRGMASLTTPKVKVEMVSSQELANVTNGYATVEKTDKNKLAVTITAPADAEAMVKDDTIDLFNLSSYNNENVKVEKTAEKDGVVTTTIPLSSENYEKGQTLAYVINHSFGNFYSCVPLKALHTSKNKTYLLRLEEKETVLGTEYVAKRVDVTIDTQDSKYAAVNSDDLTNEDKIIIESTKNVEKGDVVRLAEEE